MKLFALFAFVCLFRRNLTGEVSNKNSSSSNDVVGDKTEDYKPHPNWSDTFDWQLFKMIAQEEKLNVLVSPLSLKLALVMLYEGSAGGTELQFQSILRFGPKTEVREKFHSFLESLKNRTNDTSVLNIGTRVFLESSKKPSPKFPSTIKFNYEADIEPINFSSPIQASQNINAWVKNVTEGKIEEVVQSEDLTSDLVMLVANSIYFKGQWQNQFPTDKTHSGGFYVSSSEVINVLYMSNAVRYHYCEWKSLDAKILRVPFEEKRFSMIFVLPSTKMGLSNLIQSISYENLKQQLYALEKRFVEVLIPKFKFNFSSSYSKVLQALGLNIFSNTASFPGIARGEGSGHHPLFVNDIKQKAGVEINEEGSTAYAATDIEIGNKFGFYDNYSFNASHPFFFFIEDEQTGSILFAGKIINPLQTELVLLPSRFGEDFDENTPGFSTSPPITHAAHSQKYPFQPSEAASVPTGNHFNYFDLKLLKEFDGSQNYMVSPVSIKTTLLMILEGAKGQSASDISTVLLFSDDVAGSRHRLQGLLYDIDVYNNNITVRSSNGMFLRLGYSPNPQYTSTIKSFYKAGISNLDFSNPYDAASHINSWVKQNTGGLISELINGGSLSQDTIMVIANALYFKGKWANPFDRNGTMRSPFVTSKGKEVYVPMMQTTDWFGYKMDPNLHSHVLQLPYGGGKYAMVIVLPTEKYNLDLISRILQHKEFEDIIGYLDVQEVQVKLPRFSVDFTQDLTHNLQRQGIVDIFTNRANLSGIVDHQQGLKVSNFLHRVKVEVNEEGTEAAAVTSASVIPLIGSSKPTVNVNRPFLFFIYNVQNHNILFEGRINELPNDELFSWKIPERNTQQNQPNNLNVHRQNQNPNVPVSQKVLVPSIQYQNPQRRVPESGNLQGQKGNYAHSEDSLLYTQVNPNPYNGF